MIIYIKWLMKTNKICVSDGTTKPETPPPSPTQPTPASQPAMQTSSEQQAFTQVNYNFLVYKFIPFNWALALRLIWFYTAPRLKPKLGNLDLVFNLKT